jgi:hypothetical protein
MRPQRRLWVVALGRRGKLVVADATAREIGRLTLDEALRLLFLYAEKEPIKFERLRSVGSAGT